MEALRYADVPGYTGVLFRRTFRELQQPQGLIERSRVEYPILDGLYHETKFMWRFPAGSMVIFSHMEGESDKLKHQSAEYAYIGFDELTTFTEGQYLYLFSRARTTSGVPARIRAGTNPGNIGHEWVKRRWGAWLDKKHPNPAEDGEIRWYKPEGDSEVECGPDDPEGLSRTFIRATVWDNPYIIEKDPGYVQRLKALPLVERLQLLEGDWDVMAAAGLVLKRHWFEIVDAVPAEVEGRVRFWDLAASEKQTAKDDPDFTAGARVSKHNGTYYIEHIIKARERWANVKELIGQTTEVDGRIEIGVEQEPGASGKGSIWELASWPAIQGKASLKGYRSQKDKVKRAHVWSSQAEVGNVKIVRGDWDIEGFLNECEMFPDGPHDDQVDAVSGAVQMLSAAPAFYY